MRAAAASTLIAILIVNSSCAMEEEDIGDLALATTVLDTAPDPSGQIATFPSGGPIDFSSNNTFFASVGTNGRTCGSCHLESAAWSITPALATAIANANPSDPLFAPVDGTDCPIAQNGNPAANSTELLRNGNIRIEIGIPAGADFILNGFADPHACAVKPSASRIYMYRRPLPSTNLALLPTVMWDGRESTHSAVRDDLLQQSNDATVGHAQAALALTDAQRAAIVDFELPLFTAQTVVTVGTATVDLTSGGAAGGPAFLGTDVAPAFFIGINDTFSPSFDPVAFTIFAGWEPSAPQTGLTSLQKSIGRGEHLFNTRSFAVTNVDGLNGALDASQAPVTGTCTTCHDNPEVGNHSAPLPINIGVVDAAANSPAGKTLNIKHLPIYTFRSTATGAVRTVTDPGRALITGRFKDIGKMKGPILRGLAAREPLFHNGSATIAQAINFYNLRFNIGLTSQEKTDLGNFLRSL